MSNLILEVEVHCHKVQGMMEAFTDTLYISVQKQAVQLTKKPSETADKFIDAHQQHVPTRINVLFLFINFRVPHIKY